MTKYFSTYFPRELDKKRSTVKTRNADSIEDVSFESQLSPLAKIKVKSTEVSSVNTNTLVIKKNTCWKFYLGWQTHYEMMSTNRIIRIMTFVIFLTLRQLLQEIIISLYFTVF